MITRRESILATATLLALLCVSVWSYTQFTSQRDAAFDAERSSAACRASAAVIKFADSHSSSFIVQRSAFDSLFSTAAEQAQISSTSISEIDPQPVRLIADSPYEQHPIHLAIRDVTFRQVVMFLDALPCPVEDLHLSATSDSSSTWTLDLTVNFVTSATAH